mmetsp:Transcript_19369/g.74384  ORF Transcript_19369/g.74384 Transcript_19369/m.74384 type:complete len:110 (+) Transcript_19369:90-419(+)
MATDSHDDRRPLLVMCTARWCIACKRYNPEDLQELCRQHRVHLRFIDVEDAVPGETDDRLLEEHDVDELPTFLLLQDGVLLGKYTGVAHKRPLRNVAKLLNKLKPPAGV